MTPYVVRPGDTLSAIAQRHGLTWEALYHHPANASFRQLRPNPNLIYPGDVLVIPQDAPAASSAFILYGVDGTGPHDDEAYDRKMHDSFVSQIVRDAFAMPTLKVYRRGPDWKGFGKKLLLPTTVAEEVKQLIARQPAAGDAARVFLTGYSRGAAIVINAAALLQRDGIAVEGLFLFDAVDRSFKLSAKLIPANVQYCYHALRHPDAASRQSFGNCGLHRADGKPFDGFKRFFTTHGGMGGTPWGPAGANKRGFISEGFPDGETKVTPSAEANGMQKVRDWMWAFLRHHGVLA